MLKIGIQFFAHHKGGGSTKNGRDSESKRLGAKRADGPDHSLVACGVYGKRNCGRKVTVGQHA